MFVITLDVHARNDACQLAYHTSPLG